MTYWITKLTSKNPIEDKQRALFSAIKNTAEAACEMGYREMNYTSFFGMANNKERRDRLQEALVHSVQANDVVVVQFPLWTQLNFQTEFIDGLKRRRGVKIVALIHDVIPWTYGQAYDAQNDFFLNLLRKFDMLITANDEMSERLQEEGVNLPMITLPLWDFAYQGPLQDKQFAKKVYYLADNKVNQLNYSSNTPLQIIGNGDEKLLVPKQVELLGAQDLAVVPFFFDGGFGLVDTENAIIEEGAPAAKNYWQYKNPLRLSVYLAAGFPVIVLAESPYAAWISSRNLGIVLDSLDELDEVLSDLTETEYQEMLEAVKPWQDAVSTGFFTKRTMLNVIRSLELGYTDVLYSSDDNQEDLTAFVNELTDGIFYIMLEDNFEKRAMVKFDQDGSLSGFGLSKEHHWILKKKRLHILDKNNGEIAVFNTVKNKKKMFKGRFVNEQNLNIALVPSNLTAIETLEIGLEEDRRNLSSFSEMLTPEYQTLKSLALSGKTIDGYFRQHYFVVPNDKLVLGLESFENIPYEVEKPRNTDDELSKKLIVYMPVLNAQNSTNARDRMFGAGSFSSLAAYAPANTYVLRLADNNMIAGSFLMNTKTAPDYEERVQNLIKKVAEENEIPLSNIVTFGNSRGGTDALLHGLLGGYKAVSVDPVISRKPWLVDGRDEHYQFDQIPEDFTARFNELLASSNLTKEEIQIFTNEQIDITYPYIMNLDENKVTVINHEWEFPENVTTGLSKHGGFIGRTLDKQRDLVYAVLNGFDGK